MFGKRSKAEVFIDTFAKELPEVFERVNKITVDQYIRINRMNSPKDPIPNFIIEKGLISPKK